MMWIAPQARTPGWTLDWPEMIRLFPKTRSREGTLHSFENMAAAGRLPNYKSGLPEQD